MPAETPSLPPQSALWNGASGRAWVETEDVLNRMLAPIEQALAATVAAAVDQGARQVLDIGCGTGTTTRAAARLLPEGGRCTGVDVSAPMLEAARARTTAPNVRFIGADAQRHAFEPPPFDLLISRFGVMFFDDPQAAFANLRAACAPGAPLCAWAWRSPAENPFMTVAEQAAAPLLPPLPVRPPGAPGQFAFADAARVRGWLEAAGWVDIRIDAADVACSFGAADLERFFTRRGPLGLVLPDVDAATRAQVVDVVGRAFEPYVHGDEVRFTAACWVLQARAPRA